MSFKLKYKIKPKELNQESTGWAELPRLPAFVSHKQPILINLFLAYQKKKKKKNQLDEKQKIHGTASLFDQWGLIFVSPQCFSQ